MDILVKAAAGGIAAAVCCVVLRRHSPEFAAVIVLAAGLWIMGLVLEPMEEIYGQMKRFAELSRLDGGIIRPVVKVVGISVISKGCGEVCRSAGENAVAAFVDLAGTALALTATLPLAGGVVELIAQLLA